MPRVLKIVVSSTVLAVSALQSRAYTLVTFARNRASQQFVIKTTPITVKGSAPFLHTHSASITVARMSSRWMFGLLVAALFLLDSRAAAASVTPGGIVAGSYSFGSTPVTDMQADITVETDPGNAQAFFWAHQFWLMNGNGGYFGLQTHGWLNGSDIGRMAIFSIWGATGAQPSPGASAQAFSGEGTGWSIHVPYSFQSGITYRFHVWTASGGTWSLTLTDMHSGQTVMLGTIDVPF